VQIRQPLAFDEGGKIGFFVYLYLITVFIQKWSERRAVLCPTTNQCMLRLSCSHTGVYPHLSEVLNCSQRLPLNMFEPE
jgi:hypothetical protein